MANRSDAQSYSPPAAARAAARKGLRLRREHGRGGTEVGVARARDLANGRDLPLETMRRMRSFFARHAVNKQAEGSSSAGRWGDDDNPSAGYVAWLLWGGDPARRWVESVLSRQDGGCVRYSEIRLDGAGLDPALRAALAPPRQEPGGAWIVEGIAATEGVKVYPWGRELAPYDAIVERADDFPGLRLTKEHPGVVSPDVPDDGAGIVLGAERLDALRALKVRVRVPTLDGAAGLSVGWHPVEVDDEEGEHDGERYDAVQRAMTPNHIARTHSPRNRGAGLRLDTLEVPQMAQIMIGGLVAEVDPAFAAEFTKANEKQQQRLDALEQKVGEVVAQRDEALGRVAALEADKGDRMDADEIKRLARERAALLAEAAPLVDDAARERLDSLDDDAIRAEVVKAAGVEIGEMTPAMVQGAYRVVLARRNDGGQTAADIDNRTVQQRNDSHSPFGKRVGQKHLKQNF